MNTKEFLDYYSRRDVQEAMVSFGAHREVVGRRLRGEYNKRPDVLLYPEDVPRLAREGSVSFHGSVELWKSPMAISTELRQEELAELRLGWDLLIDLDAKRLEHSRIAADLVLKALSAHGLRDVPVKFSGRSGFHIMLPFSFFPKEIAGKPTVSQFPAIPRLLALYLQEFIREKFAEELLKEEGSAGKVAESLGKKLEEVLSKDRRTIDPFVAVKFDSILISSRHLVRMPYSFNEKSWLVSIPLKPEQVREFDSASAKPENVGKAVEFGKARGRADDLLEAALLFEKKNAAGEPARKTAASAGRETYYRSGRIDDAAFPPCMRLILEQKKTDDGRKRRMFILQAFLQRAGRSVEEISEAVLVWNSGLENPLPSVYVQGQLKYLAKPRQQPMMPPNCAAEGFYRELGICKPDEFCEGVKNPITAATRHQRVINLKNRPANQKGTKWKRQPGKARPKSS
jgi:hypothetical protein